MTSAAPALSDRERRLLAALGSALTPGRTTTWVAVQHAGGNMRTARAMIASLSEAGLVEVRGDRVYLPEQVTTPERPRVPATPGCPRAPEQRWGSACDPLRMEWIGGRRCRWCGRDMEEPMGATSADPTRAQILAYLATVPTAATRNIVEATGLKRTAVLHAMRTMPDGAVVREGKHSATRYRLPRPGECESVFPPEPKPASRPTPKRAAAEPTPEPPPRVMPLSAEQVEAMKARREELDRRKADLLTHLPRLSADLVLLDAQVAACEARVGLPLVSDRLDDLRAERAAKAIELWLCDAQIAACSRG